MNQLKKRILEISKKYGLAHVGSNLSAIDILDEIYSLDEVVVSSGHAGLAYYVVVEKYTGLNAETLFEEFGVHAQMYGSLGHGFPISLGKALATKDNVYCLTSDGEWCEGSMWETLRLAKKLKAFNLKIYVNANGFGGMEKIDRKQLRDRIMSFGFPVEFRKTSNKPLKGLGAHYEKVI